MKKDLSRIKENTEKSFEKLKQLDKMAASVEFLEMSGERLEQSGDSLYEEVKTVSKEVRELRDEIRLRSKGQPGFCQKHGHTTLIWKKEDGWKCIECVLGK
jgi:hypothetical protein